MIELNLKFVEDMLSAFDADTAEYYGYDEELWSLDFRKKSDVIYAVNKWIRPNILRVKEKYPMIYLYAKEGLRYLFTLGETPELRNDLPSMGYPNLDMTMDEYKIALKNFMPWYWEALFDEPFVAADLSQYRVRIDKNFVDYPNNPELWGEPEYKK